MLRSRSRNFLSYYINMFKTMSSLGLAPIQWIESESRFTRGGFVDYSISWFFNILVWFEFIFLNGQLVWLLNFSPSYTMEDLVLMATWIAFNIVSSGVYVVFFFRMTDFIQSISGFISNLALLHGTYRVGTKGIYIFM